MREILFRGAQKVDGSKSLYWYEGSLVSEKDGYTGEVEYYIQNESGSFLVIPETVGQYTGITDDNGKKIFEGDILGITNDDPDYDYITKVYLDCNTLCVDVQGQDYDYTSIGFAIEICDDECDQLEVIGNIHDNPELLKEVKNVQL